MELTSEQRERLAEALSQATGRKVDVKVVVDPSVIGGVVARVGDEVFDGSISNRLEDAKQACGERVDGTEHRSGKHRGGAPAERRELEADGRAGRGRPRHRDGDGVARVAGLPRAMANELLEFPGGVFGLAFNLDVDEIGCIILGESDKIEEGDAVKQTGTILSMPVGDGFLGRVIDALGRPLDDKGPIPSTERRNLEVQAPNVV